MKDFEKLSERQRNILRFMDQYIKQHSFPPTIREIGADTGIASTSVVNYNLNKLVNAGFLKRSEAKSRGLRLIRSFPGSIFRDVKAAHSVFHIPLYGRIVASEPVNMPEDQYPEDEIEVPAHMITGVNPAEVFALTVKGDSMMDAMIQDGDVIVLRHTNEAHNGDMVAVWMTDRNETTLKYFHHEGERIRLQPAHPSMEPIYVDPQFCQVQGKVLSVMRHIG